ncbi:HPr family phosphocarrier protein [Candidatus Omnitrophota bacterium]
MPKIKKKLIINNKQGLHARPAATFVQLANKFESKIVLKKDGDAVSGKSIMGILMLAAEKGSEIVIEADGADAQEAVAELEALVNKDE